MKAKYFLVGLMIFAGQNLFAQSTQQGLKHVEMEQYESAKKVFKNLIKADPKNGENYYYLGDVYLKTEKPDSARYIFSEALKNNENSALNYVGMGRVVYANNSTEGKRNFDKALELSKSKDEKVLDAIAEFYTDTPKNKDLAQATMLLEKAIKSDSKNPVHYLLLGDTYLEKNDGSKAIEYYKKGFELNKNWPYAYLKMGRLYARAKNYNVAVENYKKGLAIDPNYAPLHREMGEMYNKVKQYSNAINSYKKYLELSDKNFESEYRYAAYLFLNKDYKSSIEILSRLNLDKKNLDKYFINRLLSYAYYETGDYARGLENSEMFWKKAKPEVQLASDFEYYGKLLAKTANDSLAIINFNEAIKRDTAQFGLHGEMAGIYLNAKKYKEAIEEYKIKMSKGEVTLTDYLNLGKAYYYDKNYKSADSVFTKMIEVSPTVPNGYIWKARALSLSSKNAKGEVVASAEAAAQYEKYISLITDIEKNKRELGEAYNYIGVYYMSVKKDKSKADPNFKKVKELDPANKNVDEYIKAKY